MRSSPRVVCALLFLFAPLMAFAGLSPNPIIVSTSVTNLAPTSARLNAQVQTNYNNTTVTFEYKSSMMSVYYNAGSVNLTGGPGIDTASITIRDLGCAMGYSFRVSAQTVNGGSAGPTTPVSFTTPACPASTPRVTVTASGTMRSGSPVTVSADVTGGTGAIRYDFDFDGDGIFDRSGARSSLDVTYPGAFDGNVTVRVVDANGASDFNSAHVKILAPALTATVTGAPQQLCGDGDASVEPGERFNLPVRITNTGTAAASGGYAVFNTVDSTSTGPGGSTTTPETKLKLDTPAVAVGNLAAGASVDALVTFSLASDAACGRNYGISYAGGVDAAGSSAGASSLATIAVPAACQATTSCPSAKALATPRQGLYFNPARSGNGLSNFLVPGANGAQTFFGAWFTANADRTPTWYIVQGDLIGGAVKATIYSFKRDTASSTFKVNRTEAGRAVIVQLDSEHALMAWTIGTKQGAEPLQYFTAGASPSPNRSGAWYSADESGWGEVIHQFDANGASNTFAVDYIYDAAGEPRWVIGQNTTSGFTTATAHSTYAVQCPGCPWIADWASLPLASGTGTVVFDDATHGRTSTSYTLPTPLSGVWNRANLPIQLLSVPQ